MTPSMLGLRTVIYRVPDLNEAKKWYEEAFAKPPYFDEPFYVGFEIGGYELGLLPEHDNQKKGDSVEAYWGVEDIEKEHQRLVKLGAKPHTDISDVGGGIKVATLTDPWDNVVGIIFNPHFKVA